MIVFVVGSPSPAASEEAARYIRSIGHDPVTPSAILEGDKDALREEIRLMLDCEAVYALLGWEASRGACIEVRLASEIGMPVVHP